MIEPQVLSVVRTAESDAAEVAEPSACSAAGYTRKLLSCHAGERQLGFLRRPSADTMRLHINLVHLLAPLSAVFVRSFQA